MTNAAKLDFNLLILEFGAYVEVYEDNQYMTNSSDTRGTPAITLNPTFNSTGSYNFFSLVTGATLVRGSWTALPMPNWVIDRVNDMGAAEGRRLTKIIDFHPFSDNLPPLPEPDRDTSDDENFIPTLEDDDSLSNWSDTVEDQRSDGDNSSSINNSVPVPSDEDQRSEYDCSTNSESSEPVSSSLDNNNPNIDTANLSSASNAALNAANDPNEISNAAPNVANDSNDISNAVITTASDTFDNTNNIYDENDSDNNGNDSDTDDDESSNDEDLNDMPNDNDDRLDVWVNRPRRSARLANKPPLPNFNATQLSNCHTFNDLDDFFFIATTDDNNNCTSIHVSSFAD